MIYINEEKIRTNDMDCFDHLSVEAMLNFFQDVAGQHSEKLGIGFKELKAKNLFWVLVKTRLTKYGEVKPFSKIYIKTWPQDKGKIDFIRNYEIYTIDNILVAKGSSQWCLIDATTRKVVRDDSITYPVECPKERVYEDRLKAIKPNMDNYVNSYIVGNQDMDHNFHMNNSRYGGVLYSTLSLDEISKIKDCQFNYIHEAKPNDKIDLYRYDDENNIYVTGAIDGNPCFSAVVSL